MAGAFVTLDVDGSKMKTWVAVPDGPGPFPGVVVAQHAGGMDTFIRSVCDRLAEAGFAAAAPDMYHRQDGMTFEELDAMAPDDPERWPSMMAKTGQTNDNDIEQDLRASMAHEAAEQFRILFLDRKNRLLADEVQQKGTVDHAPVYPREVARRALELHATAVILVHNHPSGDPTPSRADIAMTKEVAAATSAVGVIVHDHIVIARHGHVSFRAQGLL